MTVSEGPQRHVDGRHVGMGELPDSDRPGQVLQPVQTEVAQRGSGGERCGQRVRRPYPGDFARRRVEITTRPSGP